MDRTEAIEHLKVVLKTCDVQDEEAVEMAIKALEQAKIIHCKGCKHWNPQFKTANSNGLGSCDFHNVALVTSEGFCYWAEKRGEADGINNVSLC